MDDYTLLKTAVKNLLSSAVVTTLNNTPKAYVDLNLLKEVSDLVLDDDNEIRVKINNSVDNITNLQQSLHPAVENWHNWCERIKGELKS